MKRALLPAFLLSGLLLGFVVMLTANAAYADGPKYDYDQVVAQVGGTTITRGELAEHALSQFGTVILEKELKRRVYIQEAARQAGITVSDEELKQAIDQYRTLMTIVGQLDQFNALPPHVLNDQLRPLLLAEKVMKLTVTSKDIDAAFLDNQRLFSKPARAELTCISTATMDEAKRALGQLKSGVSPGDVSVRFSVDQYLKDRKGYLGWTSKNNMGPQVSDAIFEAHNGEGLKAKEFTDIVTNQDDQTGKTEYLIFYVHDIQAMQLAKLDDTLKPAVIFLARTHKETETEPDWLAAQEKAKPWQCVADLTDPNAKPITMTPAPANPAPTAGPAPASSAAPTK